MMLRAGRYQRRSTAFLRFSPSSLICRSVASILCLCFLCIFLNSHRGSRRLPDAVKTQLFSPVGSIINLFPGDNSESGKSDLY
jgi:hypothetical protein